MPASAKGSIPRLNRIDISLVGGGECLDGLRREVVGAERLRQALFNARAEELGVGELLVGMCCNFGWRRAGSLKTS